MFRSLNAYHQHILPLKATIGPSQSLLVTTDISVDIYNSTILDLIRVELPIVLFLTFTIDCVC